MISPLLTDFYQLTMAYGYWKLGLHEREAVFHLMYRKNPFKGNYAVACGLGNVIELLNGWRFSADDIEYLRGLRMPNHQVFFSDDFLDYLKQLRFSCDVDAVSEGEVVFPGTPLVRVKGPILQCQLLESALLNIINFQTLIATKASRVCQVENGDQVIEFGMRRAQGPDGALSASRAAYIGGCGATSNVLAGQRFGIPLRGTHAHSWVTAFPDERSAFAAYAEVMPHNCVLLVDTYDSIQGVKNAIEVGKQLREKGAELQGIRLDSGDIAALSIVARQLLDEAGFTHTAIIASNNLDEYVMAEMKSKGAAVSVWGVGTHLVTAYDHPALDGVYKLSAIRDETGHWQYKLKLSEEMAKISHPGILQVKRFLNKSIPARDVLYDVEMGMPADPQVLPLSPPFNPLQSIAYTASIDLLVPIFEQGKQVYVEESIHDMRKRAIQQVTQFLKTHANGIYPVGLEKGLHELKQKLISQVSHHDIK